MASAAFAETRSDNPGEGRQQVRSQLEDLKQLHRSDTSSDYIISCYKELIDDCGDRTEAAEAVYHLARFYRTRDLDRNEMIHWFRQAVEAAEADSWVWSEARLDLAGQLRWMKDDAKAVREARTLVEQVAAKRTDQILTMARVQSELTMQCIAEDNFSGAERHCRQLLDWDEDAIKDLEPIPRRILQAFQTSTVQFLMQRLPHIPGTKKGKETWLKHFSTKYSNREWDGQVKQARHQIDSINDSAIATARLASPTSAMSTSRATFLAVNLVIVVALALLVLKNRYGLRKSIA